MGVASGCGEQEAGVASGSGWNVWVWLLGVVVRRYRIAGNIGGNYIWRIARKSKLADFNLAVFAFRLRINDVIACSPHFPHVCVRACYGVYNRQLCMRTSCLEDVLVANAWGRTVVRA